MFVETGPRTRTKAPLGAARFESKACPRATISLPFPTDTLSRDSGLQKPSLLNSSSSAIWNDCMSEAGGR
jgi:hypothetical protein